MLDDDFSLPPVSVSASPSASSKSNRILGPDGQLYTQGEAAKLGLIIRTACEACRNRKLKCSGTLPENGGCERCNSDGIQCVYSARAPIGRPKKRKAEEGDDLAATPAYTSSSKGKTKGRASSSNALKSASSRVKKDDEASSVGSPLTGHDGYPLTASPALNHANNSAFVPEQAQLPTSPPRSDTTQRSSMRDGHQAPSTAQHHFGMYADQLHTPSTPAVGASGARMASTPTIWSQNQHAFAMTPTDTMSPHSVISPALPMSSATIGHSTRPQNAQPGPSSAKLPSLDDLSVAAFLQSLDTLEISPAELFQQQQQQQHLFSAETSSSGTPVTSNTYGLGTPFDTAGVGAALNMNQLTASSVEEWATSSAILQPGLSFAVPADFSWWDLGINGADFGSATASVAATPSTEPSSMAFPTGRAAQSLMSTTLSYGSDGSQGEGVNGTTQSSPALPVSTGRARRPTFSADQLWPRGADAGMGQGQIQQTIAATETGLGWSTLPGPSNVNGRLSSAKADPAKSTGERSCCSSKSSKDASSSPVEALSMQATKSDAPAEKPSCCSSKSKPTASPEKVPKPASCCAGKTSSSGKETPHATPSSAKPEPKPCCSNHSANASSTSTIPTTPTASCAAEHPIEMGPLSTSAAVTGTSRDLDSERQRHAAQHAHHPSKVHCVPNPSGKGCTCLCDMSVALLSVKQVLRETDPSSTSHKRTLATETIQLTLTASQAITAQCACSADCPTCQSDPSTEISASLLVSTALQIYARAVRILREGFAASAVAVASSARAETVADAATTTGGAAQGFFGGLDVTIGTYKPSASNAKKIALYAIKLELKDLRRALGKISNMAQSFNHGTAGGRHGASDGSGDAAAGEHGKRQGQGQGQGMNPIDQLVILKLYRQLTELLKTVEGLEDAA